MTEKPLDEKILLVLLEATESLTPQEIAHLVGFTKPDNQAARVNPTLYQLVKAQKVERHTTDGRHPKYTLSNVVVNVD